MSAASARFSIEPEGAVQKFLVDMRLAGERSYRRWRSALDDGFAKTSLSPADRRDFLKPHPLEDYFFAGLIGLQAAAVRESFMPTVAEALLRQVALQVDEAAGRSDRIVSNMVFIIFGRIRKNREAGHGAQPQSGVGAAPSEVVTQVLLERLAIDRLKATRHLMADVDYRATLRVPVDARDIWWRAFSDRYTINPEPHPHARRSRTAARAAFLTRRTPASALFEEFAPPPSPSLPAFAQRLGKWLTPRPHAQ